MPLIPKWALGLPPGGVGQDGLRAVFPSLIDHLFTHQLLLWALNYRQVLTLNFHPPLPAKDPCAFLPERAPRSRKQAWGHPEREVIFLGAYESSIC